MRHLTVTVGGLLAIALGTARLFAAGPAVAPVPEIDGGSLTTALGLLSASILILRARRKR